MGDHPSRFEFAFSHQSHSKRESGSPLDRLLRDLIWGHIAFNSPESLGYGETSGVQLLLSNTRLPEELAEMIQEPDEKEHYSVRIADQMEARLTGEAA